MKPKRALRLYFQSYLGAGYMKPCPSKKNVRSWKSSANMEPTCEMQAFTWSNWNLIKKNKKLYLFQPLDGTRLKKERSEPDKTWSIHRILHGVTNRRRKSSRSQSKQVKLWHHCQHERRTPQLSTWRRSGSVFRFMLCGTRLWKDVVSHLWKKRFCVDERSNRIKMCSGSSWNSFMSLSPGP